MEQKGEEEEEEEEGGVEGGILTIRSNVSYDVYTVH